VNGLGQSLVALLRGIGPYLAATALAWSFENGLPFPLNRFFMFVVAALFSLLSLAMTIRLPQALNRPKAEQDGSGDAAVTVHVE
jgi:hypothetical protein